MPCLRREPSDGSIFLQTGADNSNGNADLRNQASPDTNSPATLLGESSDSPSTIDGSPPTLLNSSFMAATQAAAAKSRINADLPDFAALFQPPGGDPSVKDFLNGAVTLNGNTTYLSPASFGVDQSFTFTDFLGNSSDAMLLDQLTQIQRKNVRLSYHRISYIESITHFGPLYRNFLSNFPQFR
jgi:hypothetical protein